MDEALFEKIEQYLNGELSREEHLLFESEMAANEELASLVKLYDTVETEMKNNERNREDEMQLKKTLEQLNETYFKKEESEHRGNIKFKEEISPVESPKFEAPRNDTKIKRMMWTKLAVAAAILGFIALGVTWYLHNLKDNPQIAVNNNQPDSSKTVTKPDTTHVNNPDTAHLQENIPPPNLAKENKKAALGHQPNQEVLFASNYKRDVTPDDKEGPLEDAFYYYDKGDYKNAIAAIDGADLNNTRGPETDLKLTTFYAHYYKAQSYIADNDVVKAIPELKKAISESPDSSLQIKAQWYLALAYIKTGDLKPAEELLKHIAENSADLEHKSKAQLLLKKREFEEALLKKRKN